MRSFDLSATGAAARLCAAALALLGPGTAVHALAAYDAAQLAEKPLQLSLPIDCEIGTPAPGRCWLQTVVDHHMGNAVQDFRCGARSYNADNRFGQAHQGVDIGPLDWADFKGRINVLAAAPGRVTGMRNTMPDQRVLRGEASKDVVAKACGNAVGIDHGGGWFTQYCHMREGSVTVRVGDQVTRGQKLGVVGVSGLTSHPHLHFQTMRRVDGALIPVDPFDGTLLTEPCAADGASLWDAKAQEALAYRPVEVVKIGFTIGKVNDRTLLHDLRPAKRLRFGGEDVVSVFAYFAGSHVGEVAQVEVRDPTGAVVLSGSRATSHYRTRQFVTAPLSTARRFNGTPGDYVLHFRVTSPDGTVLAQAEARADLER